MEENVPEKRHHNLVNQDIDSDIIFQIFFQNGFYDIVKLIPT